MQLKLKMLKVKQILYIKLKLLQRKQTKTQYWLLLCSYAKQYPDCKELLAKVEELNKVLGKILSIAKGKSPFSYMFSFLFSEEFFSFAHLDICTFAYFSNYFNVQKSTHSK